MEQKKIDKARALRAQGWTLVRIGAKLGFSKQHIHAYVKDVVCPVDHRVESARKRLKKAWKDPAMRNQMREKISNTLIQYHEAKRLESKKGKAKNG